MSDVIRLARHARHYLAVFDGGQALALYHSKRLAAPGQRIVLYGKERGCSAPGCDVKGYFCVVHHVIPYAQSPSADVNQLTFACGGHHPLADKGWSTRKTPTATPNGYPHPRLVWINGPTPHQHHASPEKLLHADEDGEDG
nr:hypothetical protein BIN_B_05544 [Mycobacterium kansasii]